MKNIAKVLGVDENIEEEAIISINNIELVTFVAYAPYEIELGKEYPTEISFFIDEVELFENPNETIKLIQDGDSFKYTISGYLNKNGQLDVGFLIEDDLFADYQYLYGKYVTFKVDRINLEFLEMKLSY